MVPPAATETAGGGGGGSGGAVKDRDLGRRMCIQDFQVTSKLGMGKFGIVYKAKSKQSHKTVAIKVIYKSSLRDGNYQDAVNLDRERRLQANLRHPNIVGIQDSFQDPKFVYLVLDFASGGDVYKVLSQERHKMGLPHEVAAAYLYDAASAVDYLHRMHVMHRDLKAENLLVDSKGRLQLSDFGWAVHAKPPHQHIRRTMCGTPEYAPPEILARHPEYTKAVDIWSLGVLAFELLTGKTPFSRAHPATSPQTAADWNDNDGSSTQTSRSPNDGSGPTATGMQGAPGSAEAAAAAEVEEIHKGDDHAKLYGRIAGWGGSRASLFGRGTRGSGAPELAQDVVMAMLRPVPGDRLEAGEVLKLPWVALRGKGAAASATT
ncbi:unnamed protein product [Ectocarpus sp. CCAP 1310/34]|nr:unnamed protein product [Ectocarpus sp. CCAP 1310/34]